MIVDGLGKGIAIAACAIAIAYVAVELKSGACLWAFVPVAWMAQSMWGKESNEEDE